MKLSTERPSKADTTRDRMMRDLAGKSGRMRRLSVEVDAELYRRIKLRATEEDCSISEITRALWAKYLNK